MEVEADGPLKACTGISLQSEDGKSTALSKILNLVQPWMQNGSIHVFKSVLGNLSSRSNPMERLLSKTPVAQKPETTCRQGGKAVARHVSWPLTGARPLLASRTGVCGLPGWI